VTAVRAASRVAAAGAAAALGLAVLTGCAYVDTNPGLEDAAAPGAQAGVTVERVLEAAEYVEGRTVSVDAVVTGTIGDAAMTVTDEQSGAGPLLVVHEPGYDPVVGGAVRVTGVVRQSFDQESFETEVGVDQDEEQFVPFAAEPYLMAVTIEPRGG
jgi:hypothetical protein